MAVDGSLFFNTKVDTSGFFKGRKAISNACGGIKSAFAKIGATIATAFSVKAIIDFSKACVNAANQTTNAFQGLKSIIDGQGRSYSQATEWVKEYVSDGLIPLQNAVTAYKNLASRGYSDAQIKATLTALKDSAAYGRQSAYTIGDAVQTATEGLKNENSILVDNAGVTKNVAKMWQDYAKSIGTSSVKLTQQQKIQAEVNGILTETRFQTGDAEKVAKSFSGQLSKLTFNFNELKVAIGNILTTYLNPIVTGLNLALSKLTQLIKSSYSALGIIDTTSAVSSGLGNSTGKAAENYSDMAESAEQAAEANEKSLASFDKITKLGKAETAENTNIDSNINTVGGNIKTSLDIDTDDANEKVNAFFDRIKQGFKDLVQPIKAAWDTTGSYVISSAQSMFKSLKNTIEEIAKSFMEVWTNGTGKKAVENLLVIFSDILQIIRDISDAFRNAWQDYGTALIQSYFDRFNAILELIHEIANSFKIMWNNGTGEQLLGDIFQIITNINDTVKNLADNFRNAWNTDGISDEIMQNLGDLLTIISDHIKNISDSIKNWSENVDFKPLLESFEHLQEALNPIVDAVGDGLEWILNEILEPLASWTIGDLIPTFLNTLADVLDGLKAIWDKASPILKEDLWDKFLQPLAKWAGNAVISLLKGLGTSIKTLGESITEGQVNVLVKLVETLLLLKGLSAINGTVKGFATNVSKQFLGIRRSFRSVVIGLQSEVTLSFGTIGAAISAAIVGWQIGTLIYEGLCEKVNWQEHFNNVMDSIVGKLKGFGENWKSGWDDLWSGFGDTWENLLAGIGETTSKCMSDNVTTVEASAGTIGTTFSNLTTGAKENWNSFSEDLSIIKDSFKNAGEEIKSKAEDMKTALGDRVEDIKGLWGDLADKTGEKAENIKTSFGDMKTSIGDKFAEIKTNVGSKMEEVRKNLQDKTQDIKTDWGDKWENVKKKFGDVWADIKKNGGDKLGEIKKNIEDGSGNIKKGWCDTWDAVGNKIGEVWDGIKNTVKDGANGVIGWIEGLINKVIDGINWLTDGMNQALHFEAPDWVRDTFGVDSFGLSLPTINQVSLPRLATGTVVPPNYGEFLAVLGDNKRETEVVSPLSTIKQAVAEAGGNGNIKIDLNVNLDGRQVYKSVIEQGKQAKKRTGRNPFMI